MQPLDGLIVVNKPVGMTSTRALDIVRRLTGQRKSGHAGTLDPAASGVLLICLGRATKLVERLMDLSKVYRAEARLDLTSDSFDIETRTVRPVEVMSIPTEEQVRAACALFEGEIQQTPPAHSAVKIGGQPAYKFARRGQEVALAARTVRIDRLTVTHYAWPELAFDVACGRGTYIRALIRDIALKLNTGGCLTGLVRISVGPFQVSAACALGEHPSAGNVLASVLSLAEVSSRLDGPCIEPAEVLPPRHTPT